MRYFVNLVCSIVFVTAGAGIGVCAEDDLLLSAAYCLGSIDRTLEHPGEVFRCGEPDERPECTSYLASAENHVLPKAREARNLLSTFIANRGEVLDIHADDPLATAYRRGVNEKSICVRAISYSGCSDMCRKQADPQKQLKQFQQCYTSCIFDIEPVCIEAQNCSTSNPDNFKPFQG